VKEAFMPGVVKTLGGACAVVVAVVVVWSSVVSAHVTITTYGPVAAGSFTKLGFSVPNERDDAGTVKLSVQLPKDHPLAFVSVQRVPGWDVTTTTRKLDTPLEGEGSSISEVVDTITWTATGDTQIAPGQFELFWISAGQMPTDAAELVFPAVQTYSSGEEVAWIEASTAGGAEPEHPAPSVQLVAAGAASDDPVAGSDDGDSNALSIVALVVGAAGLVVAIAAIVVSRRRPAAASPRVGG
jgi:uncharacterized protein YcnI